MCRSIKILFNFAPPATDAEIRAAARQFVRKISGFAKPSKLNEAAFIDAVNKIENVSRTLLHGLHTHAPAKDRAQETLKAQARRRRDGYSRTPQAL